MQHLDDRQIEAVLAATIPMAERALVASHLTDCDACRERVAQAQEEERDLFALLAAVDHPVPAITAGTVARRAQSRGVALMKVAAVVVFAVGMAGVAYATTEWPGVSRWLTTGSERTASTPAPAVIPHTVERADTVGASLMPGAHFVVRFSDPAPSGDLRIGLIDGAEVVVLALRGTVTFTSAIDELQLTDTRAGATYDVQIPRAARHVEVLVRGTRVFLKDGERIVSDGVRTSDGTTLVALR